MRAWLRHIIIAALGLMVLVGTFCTEWLDEVDARCPSTWSRCERSYAYVTGVERDHATTADEGTRVDHCNIVARLPRERLADKPTGPDERLLEGATRIDARESDYDRVCDQWLRTWQTVIYDPQHRSRARFVALPKSSGFDLRKLLLVIVAALCLGYPMWARYGGHISRCAREAWSGRRQSRTQRKHDRAKRKREAFYAEVRAESAKIDASVAADEAAKHTRDPER